MIALSCSRVIRNRLGVTSRPPDAPEPTTRLGNWYVHLVRLGPWQYVLATSERPLLTVVLSARELRATMEGNLRVEATKLLLALNIPPEIVSSEVEEMQPVITAPATNRRVLGSMNELAFHRGVRQDQLKDPVDMAVSLSGIPMSAVGSKSHYGIPRDVALDLLVNPGH